MRYQKSSLILFFLVQPGPQGLSIEHQLRSFREFHSPSADNTLDLELVCSQLFVWKLLNLTEEESLIYPGGDNEIDFTKLLISLSSVDYTRKRLESTGLLGNRAYLTDLLGCWAWNSGYYWSSIDNVSNGNAVLLLDLGANLNGQMCPRYGLTHMTIWQYILLSATRDDSKSLSTDFVQALLQSQADVNTVFTYFYAQDPAISRWSSKRKADMTNAFMIFRYSPWDVVMASSSVTDGVKALLDQAGAISGRKRALWFDPLSSWQVLSDQIHGKFMIGIFSSATMYRMSATGNGMGDEAFRIVMEELFTDDDSEVFLNGRDAFRAAGWSDNELREEPMLKDVWDDLSSSTDLDETNV